MLEATLFVNLLIDGLVTGSIYALLAIGFSLMWWLSDIVHLAHGGVMLVGGYALFVVGSSFGLPLWIALVAALLAVIIVGLTIDEVIYKPLQDRRTGELGLITASLGILIALEFAITIGFGPEGVRADATGLRGPIASPMLIALDTYAVLVFLTTLAIFALLTFFMGHMRLGREMRAVAANRELAKVLGVNSRMVQRTTVILASALVLPVCTFYLFNVGVRPYEVLHIVLVASVVATVGGRGSIAGALVGGLIVGIGESVMIWFFDAGWRQVITFMLLYVLLLVRPQGIFAKA